MNISKILSSIIVVILLFFVELNLCEIEFLARNVARLRTVMAEVNEKVSRTFKSNQNCSFVVESSAYEAQTEVDRTIEEYLKELEKKMNKLNDIIHVR